MDIVILILHLPFQPQKQLGNFMLTDYPVCDPKAGRSYNDEQIITFLSNKP